MITCQYCKHDFTNSQYSKHILRQTACISWQDMHQLIKDVAKRNEDKDLQTQIGKLQNESKDLRKQIEHFQKDKLGMDLVYKSNIIENKQRNQSKINQYDFRISGLEYELEKMVRNYDFTRNLCLKHASLMIAKEEIIERLNNSTLNNKWGDIFIVSKQLSNNKKRSFKNEISKMHTESDVKSYIESLGMYLYKFQYDKTSHSLTIEISHERLECQICFNNIVVYKNKCINCKTCNICNECETKQIKQFKRCAFCNTEYNKTI
jgi:hypothetical protein